MKWEDFITKLKVGKKSGKTLGLQVPAITTLIYSGAFDSMLPEGTKPDHHLYAKMHEEVKVALKSKAALPGAKKNDIIGIDGIDGKAVLSIWRYQNDPTSGFDLLKACKESIKESGFVDNYDSVYKYIRRGDHKKDIKVAYLTTKWRQLFDNRTKFETFSSGAEEIGVVGIVTSATLRPYGEGKERLVFKLYTGEEYTDDIIVWPDKTGRVNEGAKAAFKQTKVVLALIKPTEWNGMPGGTLLNWKPVLIREGL